MNEKPKNNCSDRPRCERCRYRKSAKGVFWVCTKCAYWMRPYKAKRKNVLRSCQHLEAS